MHKYSPVLWNTRQSVNEFSFVQVAQYTYVSNFQINFRLYELLSFTNLPLFSAVFSPVVSSRSPLMCAGQAILRCLRRRRLSSCMLSHVVLVALLWNLLFSVSIILCRLNLKGILIHLIFTKDGTLLVYTLTKKKLIV